jgi:methionine-rich copper-binding protein CopC
MNALPGYIPLGLLLTTTLARAHAFLDYSEPAVGATVNAPPAQVKIWFTEKLHHATSTIQVFDAVGREVDKKDVTFDAKNELEMGVSLVELPPGTYKVVWNAVAIDTHHTHGTFPFTVK